ncbi:radical SAM protein [Marinifilum fragile]|uniref:radical SAM protein n=1 Tax=Marinifilum fragile TaxID=570161 RepID=UPI002AA735C5|nr:radical SAM protein [Marinifilum fragile]
MAKIRQTKSKHFVKIIPNYGMLVFSPFTGLSYAIAEEYVDNTLSWLNGSNNIKLEKEITEPLSIGWKTPYSKSNFQSNSYLPNKEAWHNSFQPNEMIAINWFLTGKCNFQCHYCIADDLMHDQCKEPSEEDIIRTANNILTYKPLFVVLSGGEPLLSPHIKLAIEILSAKAGIVIDTNGTLLSEEFIDFCKQHNVVIRISLDSPRPRENYKLRIQKNTKVNDYYNTILNNIIYCNKVEIGLIVQTVATKLNKNDLGNMGDTLLKLGVKGWRILAVQLEKENKINLFGKTVCTNSFEKNFSSKFKDLKKLHDSRWNNMFSLQIIENSHHDKNAVILISPDGTFMTQSHLEKGKIPLDEDYLKQPRKKSILERVNIFAHYSRYLNN